MTDKPDPLHCETCGAEVTVHGRTTQHYEPVFTREKVEGLLKALEFYAHKKSYFDGIPGHQLQDRHHIEWQRDNGERARTALKVWREEN